VLFAAARRHVDQLLRTAQAAGLRVLSVTSSAIALAAAADGSQASRRVVLHVCPGGTEVAIASSDAPPTVQRLSAVLFGGADAESHARFGEQLAGELRRLALLWPGSGGPDGSSELVVPTGVGLCPADTASLADRVSLPVRSIACPDGLDGGEALSDPDSGRYAAAASLAMAGVSGAEPSFDLLHSRLAPRSGRGLGRKALWAAAAAAVLLIAVIAMLLGWRSNVHAAGELEARLAEMSDSVAQASEIVEKTSAARPWYQPTPQYLECMRELTLAFPEEGTIWATSLGVGEDLRVTLEGKAVSEVAVLEVLDRLRENPRFSDVRYGRESSGSQREVSFAMSCRFVPGS
jgi:hypothetical protein